MSDNVAGLESLSQQFMPEDSAGSGDGKLKFIHEQCLECIKSSHDRFSQDSSQMLNDAIQKIDQLEQASEDSSTKKQLSNIKIALQELPMEGEITFNKMVTAVDLGLQDQTPAGFEGGIQVQLSSMATQEASNDGHDQSDDTKTSKNKRAPKTKEKPSILEKFLKWFSKTTDRN